MSSKKVNEQPGDNVAGTPPVINKDDLKDLAEVFLLARGNQMSINNESTMANLINYKKDLADRINNTLKILDK
jgi:hypothetical protein